MSDIPLVEIPAELLAQMREKVWFHTASLFAVERSTPVLQGHCDMRRGGQEGRATMTPHRRLCLTLIGSLVCGAVGLTAQQLPIKLPSAEVIAPPQWTRVLKMPDGRTFVTDGGMSIDVRIAKPATLPSVVLPPESGKIIADRMATPHDHEIGLGDLRTGSFKNSFATPDGIELNGNYVGFLRQTTPSAKMRLRTKGKRDAVVVTIDGEAVAIMMPLAPVSK